MYKLKTHLGKAYKLQKNFQENVKGKWFQSHRVKLSILVSNSLMSLSINNISFFNEVLLLLLALYKLYSKCRYLLAIL